MGTTGASMLLIRPLIRANDNRKHVAHVVVFFIFIVSNAGGALTPLGDPPLFLGFLKGVDFFWTVTHLWSHTLFLVGVLTGTVFYGTFKPVFIELISQDKISIGPPYYALTFVPIAAVLLVLVVFGPMLNWKRDGARAVLERLRVPGGVAGVALIAALLLALTTGGWKAVVTAIGLALSAWLLTGSAAILVRRWWSGRAYLGRSIRTTPRSMVGLTLAHSERMGAIESFAADVAHEIRNPLTSLRSAVETLDLVGDGPARARLLSVLKNDVQRLDRLVTDISNASRLDAELSRDEPRRVDLARLIGDIVALYQATA
eukprot:gene6056-8203_t